MHDYVTYRVTIQGRNATSKEIAIVHTAFFDFGVDPLAMRNVAASLVEYYPGHYFDGLPQDIDVPVLARDPFEAITKAKNWCDQELPNEYLLSEGV